MKMTCIPAVVGLLAKKRLQHGKKGSAGMNIS